MAQGLAGTPFVGHDLDADNLPLLRSGVLTAVLHHDLRADLRAGLTQLLRAHPWSRVRRPPRPRRPRSSRRGTFRRGCRVDPRGTHKSSYDIIRGPATMPVEGQDHQDVGQSSSAVAAMAEARSTATSKRR